MLQGALHSNLVEALEADSLSPGRPTLKLITKVWHASKTIIGYSGLTEYTPIWDNKYLTDLILMGKIKEWEVSGIGKLAQLYGGSTLKSFAELRGEYDIPNHSFYRYLQIRHALNAHFKTQTVEWCKAPLIQQIVKSGSSKGLLSKIYKQLRTKIIIGERLAKNKNRWEEDLGGKNN